MYKSKITYFFFCFFIAFQVHAQFNVKVGYGFGYTPAANNNSLIGDFNVQNEARIDKEMGDLHFVSGLEIGLRYKLENIAFELSFQNLGSEKNALGEEPDTEELFRQELFWGMTQYSLAIENIWNGYGYGVGLGRRNVKFKEDIASTNEKRTLASEANYITKLYLIFDFEGTKSLSFQLRPFIDIPWGNTSIDAVSESLNLANSTDLDDKFLVFGISLSFYNGPQR